MKLYLCTLFVCCSILAHGQFNRGDHFVGGTFSLDLASGKAGDAKTKYTQCSVFPSFGYFLNDKYAVGGGIGLSHRRSKFENEVGDVQKQRTSTFDLNASVGRYFFLSDKFVFRLNGTVRYHRQHQKDGVSSYEIKDKSHGVGLYLTPALIFFPVPQWGIEGSIGSLNLTHSRSLSSDYKNTSLGLDYGYLSLGFAYYFRSASDSQQ